MLEVLLFLLLLLMKILFINLVVLIMVNYPKLLKNIIDKLIHELLLIQKFELIKLQKEIYLA